MSVLSDTSPYFWQAFICDPGYSSALPFGRWELGSQRKEVTGELLHEWLYETRLQHMALMKSWRMRLQGSKSDRIISTLTLQGFWMVQLQEWRQATDAIYMPRHGMRCSGCERKNVRADTYSMPYPNKSVIKIRTPPVQRGDGTVREHVCVFVTARVCQSVESENLLADQLCVYNEHCMMWNMIKQYYNMNDICPWRTWYWCVANEPSAVFGALICSF